MCQPAGLASSTRMTMAHTPFPFPITDSSTCSHLLALSSSPLPGIYEAPLPLPEGSGPWLVSDLANCSLSPAPASLPPADGRLGGMLEGGWGWGRIRRGMCVFWGTAKHRVSHRLTSWPVSASWAGAPKRGCPEVSGFKPGSVQGSRGGRSLVGHA